MATKPDKIVDQYIELESQFILRLPREPAKALREALKTGASLKDRLFIKLENDVRKGQVKFDHWTFYARVVDLPCIIESLKTIDLKSTYKTADIAQMIICKEDDDPIPSDEEDKNKNNKKKDPLKVDKKYLWPHGITPPMKNVRRRRFRKTLRKKYVEAPEIEKEVKQLLRSDSDAVNVKWEVINEQDEKSKALGVSLKDELLVQGVAHNVMNEDSQNVDVAEHDIFGEAVSDSDEDETNNNLLALDEDNSRLSGEDTSRLSDSVPLQGTSSRGELITEFRKEMFNREDDFVVQMPSVKSETYYEQPSSVSSVQDFSIKSETSTSYDYDVDKANDESKYRREFMSVESSNAENIRAKMNILQVELAELKNRRHQQELEIANIENIALRQRFQDILDNLLTEQLEKEQEYQELASELSGNG